MKGLEINKTDCYGGCSEETGRYMEELPLPITAVMEYKNNSRIHFSYSDSTSS